MANGTDRGHPDVSGEGRSGGVGTRVFGPQADGREGGLIWEFNVKLENGRYVVCGSRTSKLDDETQLKR